MDVGLVVLLPLGYFRSLTLTVIACSLRALTALRVRSDDSTCNGQRYDAVRTRNGTAVNRYGTGEFPPRVLRRRVRPRSRFLLRSARDIRRPVERNKMITAKNRIPCFTQERLEAISRVLGDTANGLTGSQIGHILENIRVPDVSPDMTKWKRLYNALVEWQNQHQMGNHVILFINKALDPVSYTRDRDSLTWRQRELNLVLSFCGYRVRDDGKVASCEKAATLDDAHRLAGRMKAELERRSCHPEALRFCAAEIVAENCFHAVLEAMKGITSRLRQLSGRSDDGSDLVTACFLGKTPILRINALSSESDKGEQRGFGNLLIGLYGTYRNPTAHEARIEWPMTEQDALDVLTAISLAHRKLDRAVRA